jgi:hypothetical protein
LILAILVALLPSGCKNKIGAGSKPAPVFRDAYSFYILNPGPFKVVGSEGPAEDNFLVLDDGPIELSCGRFAGVYLGSGTPDADLESFSRETVEDSRWMPGCHRWLLGGGEIMIGQRPYYNSTLLIRRDPVLSQHLTGIQRAVHKSELERFADNKDMIVRLYYAVQDKDIYILTLSGEPEEIAARDQDVEDLLANVRLNAAEAVAAGGSTGPGENAPK